jgi:hypothetical protein
VAEIVVEMEIASISLVNLLYGGQAPASRASARRRPIKAPVAAS